MFEENKDALKDDTVWKKEVKSAVEMANMFKCPERNCKHGGKLSAWPPIQDKESEQFALIFEESKLFEDQLQCYHSKKSYKETTLGYGIDLKKIPRTGMIQYASPSLDLISLKTFMNEGIRWSSNNESFQFWLPAYFGQTDNKDRFLQMATKAISMIMTNTTKRFSELQVLEVYPKILLTLTLLIVQRKRHPSIHILRLYSQFYGQWILFMEKYPALYDEIDRRITLFIKEESQRNKDQIPNLGVMALYLLVSKKYKFMDVAPHYLSEQLDRQVLWIIKNVPELVDEKKASELTEERAKLTFTCELVSYHMLCFWKMYITEIKEQHKSPEQVLSNLEKNFGRFTEKEEQKLQDIIKNTIPKIEDHNLYFKFVGLPVKKLEEINEMLLQAIKNSRQKKYHGQLDEIHTLPTTTEQFANLLSKLPKTSDYYDIQTEKKNQAQKNGKKQYKISYKLKENLTEEQWKEDCLKRWVWIKEALEANPKLTPTHFAEKSSEIINETQTTVTNKLNDNIQRVYLKKEGKYSAPALPFPEHTWHKLFLKLDLEEHLVYFDMLIDFHMFYEKLEVCSEQLTALVLPLINITQIQSGYFYITQVLSKLKKLEVLEITSKITPYISYTQKGINSLNKGLVNFLSQKGNLKQITFRNFYVSGNPNLIIDKFFTPLSQMAALEKIVFFNTNLLSIGSSSKTFGSIITNLKNLQILELSRLDDLQAHQAKEIADGLMRSKQIVSFTMSQNRSVGYQGLASCVYNLSFAPRLSFLNISNTPQLAGNVTELVESIYKMLRISTSIEILDCSQIQNFNPNLTQDFFISLGEVRSLRILEIQGSGQFASGSLVNFGKAIAFNARKKGALEWINFKGTIANYAVLQILHENMSVSDYDYEMWYGDPNKASKMLAESYKKQYFNNLRSL